MPSEKRIWKLNNFTNSEVERYVFYLAVFLNLIPLFTAKFYGTLDGPAHLYNAQLIKELVLHPESWLHDYYDFNHRLVPNYLSHIILGLLSVILPGFVSEKILLVAYAVVFPLAFRNLILTINKANSMLSFFAFVFIYNTTFEMGFYNFNIALILMMVIMSRIIKEFSKSQPTSIYLLFFLMILLYFSHLFVLFTVFMLFGIYILIEFLKTKSDTDESRHLATHKLKIKAWYLLRISFIPLILTMIYLSTGQSNSEWAIEFLTKVEKLYSIRSLNAEYNIVYPTIYVALVILSITVLKKKTINPIQSRIWGLAVIFMLWCFTFLPNEFGGGGFFKIRFALLIYLFLTFWLATRSIPKWLLVFSVLLILTVESAGIHNHYKYHKALGNHTKYIMAASQYIEENSVVLPIVTIENWLCNHTSNYLGVDKSMVLLENYEAEQDHFPLIWNRDLEIDGYPKQDLFTEEFSLKWTGQMNGKKRFVDYIVFIQSIENIRVDKWNRILGKIKAEYSLIYKNKDIEVYKRNL